MARRFVLFLVACVLAFSVSAQHSWGSLMGAGKAGDVVKIYSPDNGVRRSITLKEDGKFQLLRLPVGFYEVTITHSDGTVDEAGAQVRAGMTARFK